MRLLIGAAALAAVCALTAWHALKLHQAGQVQRTSMLLRHRLAPAVACYCMGTGLACTSLVDTPASRWAVMAVTSAAAIVCVILVRELEHRLVAEQPEPADRPDSLVSPDDEEAFLRAAVDKALAQGDWVLRRDDRRFIELAYTEHRDASPEQRRRHDSPAYNRQIDLHIMRGWFGVGWTVVVDERPAPWTAPRAREIDIESALTILDKPWEAWTCRTD